MKMHLPHGLRVALMAAIASVSLTSYAAATDVTVDGNYYGYQQTSGNLNLFFMPSGSFNRENVNRLYVLTASHTGDVNATVQQSLLGSQSNGYYLVGMGSKISLDGSLSLSTVATGATATNRGNVLGLDYSDTVTGNVYMGLADNNTYSGWVYGVMNSTVQGTSKLEIASGTFNGNVAVGYVNSWSNTNTVLNKGTELKITNGTFTNTVAAGCVMASGPGSAIINSGTNLVIRGGEFANTSTIVAGNTGTGTSTISGGTHTTISRGTFNTTVYGGSTNANSTINDGVDISITGGTFGSGSKVYALGSAGTVKGAVNLTIGNDAWFSDNSVISAGTNGSANYSGVTSSTVTLKDIKHNYEYGAWLSNSSITVDGGQQQSDLVLDEVDDYIIAKLQNFKSITVKGMRGAAIEQPDNETLGGASTITIQSGSYLSLTSNDVGEWDLSGKTLQGEGELRKAGSGTLTIGNASDFTGKFTLVYGTLRLSAPTSAQLTVYSSCTLSVKEGNLFADGYDKAVSLAKVTLDASEGNWTLNSAATVSNIIITGNQGVAFGSEVNPDAVVTMSGNINATNGHLYLKNTVVAAGKEATLSGTITFENAVKNSGTIKFYYGTNIDIDEQSLTHGDHFVDTDAQGKTVQGRNGFLADSEISLIDGAEGSSYQLADSNPRLTLDGKEAGLTLVQKGNSLSVSVLSTAEAGTYFVNEGDVAYSHITEAARAQKQTLSRIALGNDGIGDNHTLVLDGALAAGVTIESESDFAKVSVNSGVVLNASQTAIKGEANKVHVTGAGAVLLDDAAKLSQLAGDATMKVTKNTTVTGEAKMTGELNVESGDLTVTDEGTIASFSSVNLADNTTLAIETTHNDAIQSLSGSGKLVKTGEGTTLTVQDASGFTGDISVSDKALVNLLGVDEGVNVSLHELVIDNGTLGVYVGDTPGAGANEANVGALTLTGGSRIVVGGNGGTLEANLTTMEGSILDFSAGAALTMGCNLTVGDGTQIVISGDAYASLMDGENITLFTGVDNSFCMDVTGYVTNGISSVSEGGAMPTKVYLQTMEGGAVVLSTTANTPEPTTATLSLLALAGLAARRRRSKAVAA